MNARLVLDDLPWSKADLTNSAIEEVLEGLRELLEQAEDRKHKVAAHDSLHVQERIGSKTIENLIEGPIPRDLRVEMRRRLNKIHLFGDDEIECFEVIVDDERALAPTIVWAAQQTKSGSTTGCITPACSCRKELCLVTLYPRDEELTQELFFVFDSLTHAGIFRHAIIVEHVNDKKFADLAPSAFPQLEFVDGAFGGCRELSRPFINRRNDIMKHLAVLNDFGVSIFALRQHKLIIEKFKSHGIEISLENTETMRDGKCRRARERMYHGEMLIFEWHTKISPHLDRIHVHPPTANSGGRVIIGIINKHLPLPGDS